MRYWADMTLDEWAAAIADWRQRKKFVTGWGNAIEKVAVLCEEAAEPVKVLRKIPLDREKFREELCDVIVRCLDFLGSTRGIPVGRKMVLVMEANELRPPKHGKAF